MRRFAPYPICISGSAFDEDFRAFVELISPWLARLKQARAQDLQHSRIDTRPTARGGLPPPVNH